MGPRGSPLPVPRRRGEANNAGPGGWPGEDGMELDGMGAGGQPGRRQRRHKAHTHLRSAARPAGRRARAAAGRGGGRAGVWEEKGGFLFPLEFERRK